jgi:hypothetical protein
MPSVARFGQHFRIAFGIQIAGPAQAMGCPAGQDNAQTGSADPRQAPRCAGWHCPWRNFSLVRSDFRDAATQREKVPSTSSDCILRGPQAVMDDSITPTVGPLPRRPQLAPHCTMNGRRDYRIDRGSVRSMANNTRMDPPRQESEKFAAARRECHRALDCLLDSVRNGRTQFGRALLEISLEHGAPVRRRLTIERSELFGDPK